MSAGLRIILVAGIIVWVFISLSILRYFEDNNIFNSNPFREMWHEFDLCRYNFLGKSILLILNIIIGLPTLVIVYCIILPIWLCAHLIVYCFDKLFKKE